jgi:hypothetical protein
VSEATPEPLHYHQHERTGYWDDGKDELHWQNGEEVWRQSDDVWQRPEMEGQDADMSK